MNEQIEQVETSESFVDDKLVGISGWLILPAIGFVLGPIIRISSLIENLEIFSEFARAEYGGIYTVVLIVSLGEICFQIYAATLFFRKKSNAPRIIIMFYIVNVVASGILFFAGLSLESGDGMELYVILLGKDHFVAIIAAAIWIPYFILSKRVESTFTH